MHHIFKDKLSHVNLNYLNVWFYQVQAGWYEDLSGFGYKILNAGRISDSLKVQPVWGQQIDL